MGVVSNSTVAQGGKMKRVKYLPRESRQGSALVLSLIFIVMFSAMAVAMAGMSGANVQMAHNQQKLDTTRGCAESGLEVLRYWMSKVEMSGTTPPGQRVTQLATVLQNELLAAGVTNIAPVCDGNTITIPNVTLRSSGNQSFTATFTRIDVNNVRLAITGHYGPISRTIRTNYAFDRRAHTVFDFGVASKGPLEMSGNVEIAGVNVAVESNAYIESMNTLLALSMSGNSSIAGNVKIVNPSATPFVSSNASVGGAVGAAAMANVTVGAPATNFPEMAPGVFYSYATHVLTAAEAATKDVLLTNVRIPAGMNPQFNHAAFRGVIFIEAPNVVRFNGGVEITGIIVTNGSPTDDSGTNQLIFRGHAAGLPVAQLPQEPKFAGLHSQTGTFIIAPGFAVSFGGTFDTFGGAVAANGVEFFGNAGGIIRGSVINYSSSPMKLWGNSSVMFNRSGLTEVPAGFVPEIVMRYDPSAYSEMIL
jgi:Tfp pilus assembly protein PilX